MPNRRPVALWVAHVYAIEGAPSAAYLRITSAVEESGKTTLLEVLELLLDERCLNLVSVTPSFVFRKRDKDGPVALLLDEIDNTLKDRKDDGARDLLALVNAGYRRSAKVGRSVGRNHTAQSFRAFGPAAIAGLGSLHPTTESRCIPITLERKIRGKGERWLAFLVEDEGKVIGARFGAWASEETIATLRAAHPQLPPELRDRHAEAWWSLFAIADLAGGPWPAAARTAALSLHADKDAEDSMSLAVLLLAHIRRVIEEHDVDRVSTAQLIRWLVELAEGPWAHWWAVAIDHADRGEGHALDRGGAYLASLLKPFRKADATPIKPHVVKMPDGTTARGYYIADFADAFPRYLGHPGVTSATSVTPLASTVTGVTPVTPPNQGIGTETPCPACGARSAAVGYRGHANGCPWFYGIQARR